MPLTCLLVDDSPEFLTSAARLLEAEGMRVVASCRTGREALERVSSTDALPDVILIDIELGDEDGVDVASRLAEQAPTSVVMLISGRDEDELREVLQSSSVVRFVPKARLSAAAIAALMP